jgi:hypothetical protein
MLPLLGMHGILKNCVAHSPAALPGVLVQVTLKNAKWRFAEFGWEVEKGIIPYKYKARRVGTLAWMRGDCLDVMLRAVEQELAKPRSKRT